MGLVTPGQRLPALTPNRVLYRDGAPVAIQASGDVRFLQALDAGAEWEARNALLRRAIPPPLRIYLE